MQSIFSNALSRALAKHISLSTTRRETLAWLALLIMQHGTISLWRLAAYVASATQIASVRRRFYRFFQYVRLDGALAVAWNGMGIPLIWMLLPSAGNSNTSERTELLVRGCWSWKRLRE